MKNVRFPLNLQLFADGDENPPADPQPPKEDELPKTFTQDELDRIVTERIGRERKKYGDYDELKSKLTEFEKAEEERKKSELSVTERLEAEKAEALKVAEDAQAERDRTLTAANQRLIKAEFRAKARELNVRSDALEDALQLADLSAVNVDEEGNATGVEDVIKALLTNKPYLVEKAAPKPIGGASGGEEKPDKTNAQLLEEAATKARRTGKPEDFAAYSALKLKLSN